MLIKTYSDLSLKRAGVMSNYVPMASYGAYFKLDNDVSHLFPLINAEIKDSRYSGNPEHITFIYDKFQCTLYPKEVIAITFSDRDEAARFADQFILFLNNLHKKKNTVKPNYRKYKSVSALDIFRLLPGTNCCECGFKSCLAFAAMLSVNETNIEKCPYVVKPIKQKVVYPIYDKEKNLVSTVTIETDISEVENKSPRKNKKTSFKISQTGVNVELTQREIEVLRLAADGFTNTDISESLHISPHTVKSHMIHIFNKLGVNDRTQAAVWAAQNKIL